MKDFEAYGMWKDRTDFKDGLDYENRMRKIQEVNRVPASYLVDTSVLVDSLRQNSAAQEYLDSLTNWSYSVISAMEIFAGARDKKEISALEKFFAAYPEVRFLPTLGLMVARS